MNILNTGITEEELVVIASAIRAFEGGGFQIKSVSPIALEQPAALPMPEEKAPIRRQRSAWTGAARRDHQKRL